MSCEKRNMDLGPELPKNAGMIYAENGKIRGITTNDGSFDLTPEGVKFLRSFRLEDCRIENAGIHYHGIYIDAD